jgi:hypothetical protein
MSRYNSETGQFDADTTPGQTTGVRQGAFDSACLDQQGSQWAATVEVARKRHAEQNTAQSAAQLARAEEAAIYHLSRLPERGAARNNK